MFSKFAKAEILDVKSSPSRVRHAALDHFADFEDYRTDDDFVYVRVRAISSRVNKNNDGWPSNELKKSYKTFIGKPLFVDHHNHDPKLARGVVVDAQLHIDEDTAKVSKHDPYYASAPEEHLPATWVELLLEVDAKTYPKLAKSIVEGDIDGVSMGANVEWTKCSHCGNVAHTPEEYCTHVRSKGAHFDYTDSKTGKKTSKRAYEDCYDFGFFELSFVFDPADETALISDIKTAQRRAVANAVRKEAASQDFDQQMIGRARTAYRQAQAEGADEPTMWRAAMKALFDHGIRGKEAFSMVLAAIEPHAQTVAKTAMEFDPDEAEGLAPGTEMGGEPAIEEPMAQREGEAAQILEWIRQQLAAKGMSPALVDAVAAMPEGQMHMAYGDLMKLLEQGATPEQAYGIVSKFNKEAPGKEHMKGVSDKRNRQYEHIKEQCLADGGSEEHCKEMAARTVNKQRSEHGETKDSKTADRHNPRPQAEATIAPEDVDTLRQEQICPICGSDMEDGVCVVCNYEEPPEGFDMPDLEEAQRVDEQMQQQDEQQAAQGQEGAPTNVQLQPNPGGGAGSQPGLPGPLASVSVGTANTSSSATVRVDMSANQHTAAPQDDGRVNTQEKPILPATQQTSDRPSQARTESDEREAVESSTKEQPVEENIKVADGATAAGGEDVQPDARVDVESKGGVATGDPLEDASHQSVEKSTQEHAPHTDTWSGMDGQTEAVQGKPFPTAAVKEADQIGPDPRTPDYRVDVTADLGEGELGEGTKTWTGTEGQADPVTGEVDPNIDTGEGHEHQPSGIPSVAASARRHAIKSMKLAEFEETMGLLDKADKWERAAELADTPESEIDAQIETLSKVKTAGLRKPSAEKKTAGRVPSFKPVTAAFDPADHGVDEQEVEDSRLFL